MPSAATWMDLEIIILSEVNQKDKYHMISLICGISNMTQMNLSTKQKQTCGHQGREGVGKGRIGSLELADTDYLLYIEWINK